MARDRRKKDGGRLRHRGRGLPPGTLVADPSAPQPVLRVIAYRGEDETLDTHIGSVEELPALLKAWPLVWVNVDGLGDAGVVQRLGEIFHLHRLALEDVLNTHQRPKFEAYEGFLFIVARMVDGVSPLWTDQMSLFLGPKWVITFQEVPGDCFDGVRERLKHARTRFRTSGPDYLAYTILDAVVDSYFPVLEHYGEILQNLEDEVLLQPGKQVLRRVHAVKRDLLQIRRSIWPLREALNALHREPADLIVDDTRVYLRDCYDHTIQILDLLEAHREVAWGLVDVYLSSLSNRLNEVMKVLTIISTIFIPLNFIAGVYGMNFHHESSPWNMPELDWYFGYPAVLTIMAMLSAGMLIFFWRKGWLGKDVEMPEPIEKPGQGRAPALVLNANTHLESGEMRSKPHVPTVEKSS